MKGDFSRKTFQAQLHYSAVRMQQGRVQLDADLNEQADIAGHRAERDSADVIGGCGAPLHAAAFGIVTDLATLSGAEKAALEARFGPAFSLAAGDFILTPGHYWVDGILCESEFHVPYARQPDLPGLTPLAPAQNGHHIVYLDVWRRHVTALESPLLRETALGGPDTATRTRTVWQVRTVFAGVNKVNCESEPAAFKTAVATSTGTLRAQALPESTADKPCIVPATAGFRGLENQLYRVEIHDKGDPHDLGTTSGESAITSVPASNQVLPATGSWSEGQAVEVFPTGTNADRMAGFVAHVAKVDAATKVLTLSSPLPTTTPADHRIRSLKATLKWSRDNGSVSALVTAVNGTDVAVHSLGPDEAIGFKPGDWVELVDRAHDLNGLPGHVGRVKEILPGPVLRLHAAAKPYPGDIAAVDPKRGLVARRWDGLGAVKINAPAPSDGYAELEDGVQVRFEPGTYATGDYWTIPARTATADARSGKIEWPEETPGKPAALRPAGIEHHRCRLAVLSWDGTTVALVEDCRPLFPPLTELATLEAIGGDGQEARPGNEVPQPLEVGVFRGHWPVAGVAVRFKASDGGKVAKTVGGLTAVGASDTFGDLTGANGLVACRWLPNGAGPHSQQVTIRALSTSGADLPPVVRFSGNLSTADEVAYTADAACTELAGATTVKAALDKLCARPAGGGCAVTVTPGKDLAEVVDDLYAAGGRDICVCLTAGDHVLASGLAKDDPELTLKIGGCGRSTRLRVEGGIKLVNLAAATLRDLDLFVVPDDAIAFDGCLDVALESCRIYSQGAAGSLVTLGGAERIRIGACVIDGATGREEREPVERLRDLFAIPERRERQFVLLKTAEELAGSEDARKELAEQIEAVAPDVKLLTTTEQAAHAWLRRMLLETGDRSRLLDALDAVHAAAGHGMPATAVVLRDAEADTHIADSELVGALSLYGPWNPKQAINADAPGKWGEMLKEDVLRLLPTDAGLYLRDNRLTRLTVGGVVAHQLIDQLGEPADIAAFRAALLSDNVVVGDRTLLIASHLAMTGSDFEDAARIVCVTVENSAIFTANHAPTRVSRLVSVASSRAQAANLDLIIETHL